MRTIEIELTTFNGFYESIWDFPYESFKMDCEELGIERSDEYNFRLEDYMKDVAEQYANNFEKEFKDEFGLKIFLYDTQVISPAFYNYTTDKIVCKMDIEDEVSFFDKLRYLMNQYKDKLTEIIKTNHSTRSGFISFLSNDFVYWYENIESDEDILSYTMGYLMEIAYEDKSESFDSYAYDWVEISPFEYAIPATPEAKEEYERVRKNNQ